MPDETQNGNPLDAWHCFEVLDRSHILALHFDAALADHPTVEADAELRALAEQLGDLLGSFYQRAGTLLSEAESPAEDQRPR